MSRVDFLVKLRDGAQMIADAANEYLETLAPTSIEEHDWDLEAVKWVEAEGTKGPYQRSEDVDNPEFKVMLKDLAAHNGKMTREGWFIWTFRNGSTVGRKKRK